MPALPGLSGRQAVRAFEKLGWQVARQRGSHIIMVKDGENVTLSIPDHKEVAKGSSKPDSGGGNHDGPVCALALMAVFKVRPTR